MTGAPDGPGQPDRPGRPDGATGPTPDDVVRLNAWVSGRVQGVGFRWWTRARALELGLTGSASNLEDGRVEVVAEGPVPALGALLTLLSEPVSTAGRPGHVSTVSAPLRGEPRGEVGFRER